MSESMTEHVARAICLGDPDEMVGRIKSEKSANGMMSVWSDDDDLIPAWQQTGNLVTAKQAIEAMREPTEEVLAVGTEKVGYLKASCRDADFSHSNYVTALWVAHQADTIEIWEAMIDKALEYG